MGTRGFVGFVVDDQLYTQYQQFDSYPSGVGLDVLAFASKIGDVEAMKQAVHALHVVPQSGTPTAEQADEVAGYTDRRVSTGTDWYSALRSTQGRLDLILDSGYIVDSGPFWRDSLFCEWAYLVDLDQRTLEVYRGFQEQPHSKGRFATAEPDDPAYAPIALQSVFSLSDLPTPDEFVAQTEEDA